MAGILTWAVLGLFTVTACVHRPYHVLLPSVPAAGIPVRLADTARTVEQLLFYPHTRRVWQAGPLRVRALAAGQPAYNRAGMWRTFHRNGMLAILQDYEAHRSTYFRPDGTLDCDTYNDKEEYPGDSLQRQTTVLFAHGSRADTLAVKHTEYRNNRFVRAFFSKDVAGKHPIVFPEAGKKSRPK